MGKSTGFKFSSGGNLNSKIKIILSCVELDEVFTTPVLKERLEAKGWVVSSPQALGNFIYQNMKEKYFVKDKRGTGKDRQQYWRRIA